MENPYESPDKDRCVDVTEEAEVRKGRMIVLGVCAFLIGIVLLTLGCHRTEPVDAAKPLDHATCDFDIHWPVQDPEQPLASSAQALLHGTLALDAQGVENGTASIALSITLTRPSEESDREYWNWALAYSYIRWMDEVRVWDADKKWL